MPLTPEGVFVASALDRWGIWRRAGMAGSIVGIELVEAMRAVPPQCDLALCERLFIAAETPFCAAVMRTVEDVRPERTIADER